jgi:hypothetical protein
VLYVEDNDDDVFMLKMRLELLGEFEVLTAEDGGPSDRPDIILMDLEMPVMDGWVAADSPMPRTTDNGKSDMEPVTSETTVQLSQPLSGSPPKSPDIYLGFSVLALGVPDVETVCSRQFAVQSASAARQSFEYGQSGPATTEIGV